MKSTFAIIVAATAAFGLSSPAAAHQMGYNPLDKPDPSTTAAGVMTLQLRNAYDDPAKFEVQILGAGMEPIAEDAWRSNVEDDVITLEPGAGGVFRVQVRNPGRYYVCTMRIEHSVRSRTCLKLEREF